MAGPKELFNFATKFLNLWHANHDALLSAQCNGGHASIKLELRLGDCPPAPQQKHTTRRPGPSRLRRRARRAEVRAVAAAAHAASSSPDSAEAAVQAAVPVPPTTETAVQATSPKPSTANAAVQAAAASSTSEAAVQVNLLSMNLNAAQAFYPHQSPRPLQQYHHAAAQAAPQHRAAQAQQVFPPHPQATSTPRARVQDEFCEDPEFRKLLEQKRKKEKEIEELANKSFGFKPKSSKKPF